jgi:hypothetical protein
MDHQLFDRFTRSAAARVSRRGSLLALGAAGLARLLIGPSPTKAKRGGKKKKKNRPECPPLPESPCPAQVQTCKDFRTFRCNGDPTCLSSVACCDELGTCDFNGFFACLQRVFGQEVSPS